jgi:hypothetical protein
VDGLELDGVDTHYLYSYNNKSTAYNGTDLPFSVSLPVNGNELNRDISVLLINLQINFTAQLKIECDSKQIKAYQIMFNNIKNVKLYSVVVSEI